MASGILDRAATGGMVEFVRTNEVKFREFSDRFEVGTINSLGVRELSACSVVAVVSQKAAIVAHIGPNSGKDAKEMDSFLKWAESKMDDVQHLYHRHSALFTSGTGAYVIYATLNGAITSPEQLTIFRNRIRQLGLPVKETFYERPEMSQSGKGHRGTVVVLRSGKDAQPIVYVEDKILSPGAVTRNPNVSSSSAGSGQTQRSAVPHAGPSSHAASSQPASAAPSQYPHWTRTVGTEEFLLVGEGGEILQRSRGSPIGKWTEFLDQNGRCVYWAIYNGQSWRKQ